MPRGAPGCPISSPTLQAAIAPGWSAITIDDVFVSQAGLPANLSRATMKAAFLDTRPLREQRTDVTAAALARPPRRPGRFLYSNLGYIVIGAAIERITGLEFESALTTHVFAPLGISSGGFGPPPLLWGHEGRMLALGRLGLFDLGRGGPVDPERAESDNPAIMSPAGRMHLTLADWAKFQRVFLDRGGGFLRPETVERLLTPAAGRGPEAIAGVGAGRRPGRLLRSAGVERVLGGHGADRRGTRAHRDGRVQRGASATAQADAQARLAAPRPMIPAGESGQ